MPKMKPQVTKAQVQMKPPPAMPKRSFGNGGEVKRDPQGRASAFGAAIKHCGG